MSAPIAASLVESLAGAYWQVHNIETALAERYHEAKAYRAALDHKGRAAEARQRAQESEIDARALWSMPSKGDQAS